MKLVRSDNQNVLVNDISLVKEFLNNGIQSLFLFQMTQMPD